MGLIYVSLTFEDHFVAKIIDILSDFQRNYPDDTEVPLLGISVALDNYLIARYGKNIEVQRDLDEFDYKGYHDEYQDRLIAFIEEPDFPGKFNAWILKPKPPKIQFGKGSGLTV